MERQKPRRETLRRVLPGVVIIFMILGAPACNSVDSMPSSPHTCIEAAWALEKQGRYEEASAAYAANLDRVMGDPDWVATLRFRQGMCHYRAGNYKDAQQAFTDSLSAGRRWGSLPDRAAFCVALCIAKDAKRAPALDDHGASLAAANAFADFCGIFPQSKGAPRAMCLAALFFAEGDDAENYHLWSTRLIEAFPESKWANVVKKVHMQDMQEVLFQITAASLTEGEVDTEKSGEPKKNR